MKADGVDRGRGEQEVFADLERLCSTPGYVQALAAIAMRDNLVVYSREMTPGAMSTPIGRDRTVRTEFTTLLGLMMKLPVDFVCVGPALIEKLVGKLPICSRRCTNSSCGSCTRPFRKALNPARRV